MDTKKIAEKLGLVAARHGKYRASFQNVPGVSINGFGRSEHEAYTDLFLRLLSSAGSHMDSVLSVLGHERKRLEVRETHEFLSNGDRVVHLTNAFGDRHTIIIKGWRKP